MLITADTREVVDMFTKSDFVQYLKCPQELWLKKNKPELLPPLSEQDSHNIEQGKKVDALAQELFQSSIFLTSHNINYSNVSFQKKGTDGNLVAIADIFVEFDHKKVWLFEAKAATQVKDELLDDIVFQKIVFENAGYSIEKSFLVHVNKEYTLEDSIALEELLVATEVTDAINSKYTQAVQLLPVIYDYINLPTLPKEIPFHCKPLKDCIYFKTEYNDLPKYSIFNVSRIHKKKLQELADNNIWDIKDIPSDFKLSDKQRFQVEIAQSRKPYIDKKAIRNWLDELEYPLYYLDYESFSYVIPFQKGLYPYQHAVFQYSLHVQENPSSDLVHYEYLLQSKDESIENLVAHLANHIGEKGSVIVWHNSFERSRNKELANMYPSYKTFFESVNHRIKDLEDPFKNQWYVHPDFYGKSSIKNVLPVLVPKYDYSKLEIGNGLEATLKWHHMTDARYGKDLALKTYKDLLAYCKLDTLAMVKIFEQINKLLRS